MHFAILALVSGVPVIPIAYEFKMRELFDGLGQPDLVHDIESVTSSTLLVSIDSLLESEHILRRDLFHAVADAHVRAVEANRILARRVLSSGSIDAA